MKITYTCLRCEEKKVFNASLFDTIFFHSSASFPYYVCDKCSRFERAKEEKALRDYKKRRDRYLKKWNKQ